MIFKDNFHVSADINLLHLVTLMIYLESKTINNNPSSEVCAQSQHFYAVIKIANEKIAKVDNSLYI